MLISSNLVDTSQQIPVLHSPMCPHYINQRRVRSQGPRKRDSARMFPKLRQLFGALTMGRKGGYYAVRSGRKTGVFRTWHECEINVKGFPGARFKKFDTEEEARQFVTNSTPTISGSLHAHKNKSLSWQTPPNKRKHEDAPQLCDMSSNGPATKRLRPVTNGTATSTCSTALSVNPLGLTSSSSVSTSSSQPVVYTDGCCTKNGFRGARAGIGVYWGPEHSNNVSERLEGEQTNQRAELMAAARALESARTQGYKSVEVRTDSRYTIMGVTDWIKRWKKNGFKSVNGKDVKNKEEFKKLDQLCQEIDVKWTYVPGHQGIPGNEAADSLAKEGAQKLHDQS